MSTKPALFRVIFTISIVSAVLVLIIALSYSYSPLTLLESVAGFIILLMVSGFVWLIHRGSSRVKKSVEIDLDEATAVGIALGALWLIEISINNFIALPLPLRDIVDDVFWSLIALFILIYAVFKAYHARSVVYGIKVGAWSGLVSGVLACCTALLVIVFAMRYITQDPLNIAEWSGRRAVGDVPTMASYFAYETFAGAFLHLIVLGPVMGGLLGVLGGVIGRGTRQAVQYFKKGQQSPQDAN